MAANVILQNNGLGNVMAFGPLIDSVFGQAKNSANTFQSTAAGIMGASAEARSQRLMVGAAIGLGGLVAVGFVAYLALKK